MSSIPEIRATGRISVKSLGFAPIKMAILPISPFRPSSFQDPKQIHFPGIHIGPAEAVQAHVDMRAKVSVAAHFRVFQLGFDGFNDAVNELALTLKKHHIDPGAFIAPVPGQRIVDPISPE
jgi:L-ascorbate metabolism protein UlaG (beta-lactamase superfamily)